MRKELLAYAIEGIRNKKKTTIPAFLVLCISFSFLIFATCLVGSISKTNDEFRLNTYGEWYADMLDAGEAEMNWAQNDPKVDAFGILNSDGTVACGDRKVGIGTVDEDLWNIGRMSLVDGKWPQAANEIVMEADTLCALGYDYSLEQDISLDIMIGLDEEECIFVHRDYKLVGIVKEYSDLWTVDSANGFYFLNSIITSEKGEEDLIDEIGDNGEIEYEPVKHVFIKVSEEYREDIRKQLEQFTVAFNRCVCESESSAHVDNVYIIIILIITLVAIAFTYLLQLKKQTYSYSVMRSVGMTRLQLARMVCYETMLLCTPAIIIGAIIGSSLIVVALKLLVYGGSISIQLYYNLGLLSIEILLWFATVLLSRILVFFIAVRTPLTGHLDMRQSQKKIIYCLKEVCVFAICTCFGMVIIFTGIMSLDPNRRREFVNTCPTYVLWPNDEDVLSETVEKQNMTDFDIDNISIIPGCREVYGFSEYSLEYPFEISDEYMPYLYVIDDREWEEVFEFTKLGVNLEDFRAGNSVFMCFPKERVKEFEEKIDAVDFSFRSTTGEKIENAHATISDVILISEDVNCRLVAGFTEPYTILCSANYMQRYGIQGYSRVYVYTDFTTYNKSTDVTMAEYCNKNNIFFSNRREEYQAYEQEYVQELVLLVSIGSSIGIIFILLLGCILSLEKEHQKRSYLILRTIGMSRRQWRRKQLLRSWLRALGSFIGGWLLFEGVLLVQKQTLSLVCGGLDGSGVKEMMIIVSLIALIVPFVLSAFISTIDKN